MFIEEHTLLYWILFSTINFFQPLGKILHQATEYFLLKAMVHILRKNVALFSKLLVCTLVLVQIHNFKLIVVEIYFHPGFDALTFIASFYQIFDTIGPYENKSL